MSDLLRGVTALRWVVMHFARLGVVAALAVAASAAWRGDWEAMACDLCVSAASVALWAMLWLGDPPWVKTEPKP